MPLDLKGIHQFTEADTAPTFSELLNKGMASVSNALAYFASTAVRRAALDPAPEGAMWQDTDGQRRLWSAAPDGSWRLHEGQVSDIARAWTLTAAPAYARTIEWDLPTVLAAHETVHIAATNVGNGFASIGLASVTRNPASTRIQVRFMQLGSPTTMPVQLGWRVANLGA